MSEIEDRLVELIEEITELTGWDCVVIHDDENPQGLTMGTKDYVEAMLPEIEVLNKDKLTFN